MLVKKRESARSDNAQSAGSLAPVAGVLPLQRDCTKRSPREPAKCMQSVRAVKMIFLLFTLVRAYAHATLLPSSVTRNGTQMHIRRGADKKQ
jgi:hypothetical protein